MRNRTLLLRLPVALVGACLLVVYPVVTPVWAAPKPVPPKVQTTAVGGVDAAALASSPAALDPAVVRSERSPAASSSPASDKRRATPSTRPTVLTAELSRDRFVVAGVSWTQGDNAKDPVVQVRLKEATGWTDWEALDAGDRPDPGSPDAKKAGERVSSEPIFSAAADSVQVRVDTLDGKTPDGLSVVTVDPGTSPADANLTGTPAATARSAVTMPGIVTRAQWGADESIRNCTATYSPTIKVGFVHHTVGSNSYAPSDSAAIVRGIYAYHVNGNGWCDVGYNFLVDRYGQIFEGRAGGIGKPVIGAHTGGFNYDSFGVSAMGTFTTDTPPAAMTSAISAVLGWKLGMHGRDLHGTDVLVSAGGSSTRYPAGTAVRLNVVSGHRDPGLTECPGAVLYGLLPAIRDIGTSYRNANYRTDDLYGALVDDTGSGRIEVHGASSAGAYSQRIADVASKWADGHADQWRFFVGSLQGDTRPDLVGVKTLDTGSGRTEVHTATWLSDYQSGIDVATPMGTFVPDDQWQVSLGGPSGADLYFIATRGTGTGTVEVHGVSSASSYTQWNQHTGTALATAPAGSPNRYLIARGSADLYLVRHGSSGSGRSEVHALSAASGYQAFTEHSALPNGYTTDADAQWALGTASKPDLYYLPLTGTGSGRVEAHRLSPGDHYTSWTLHAATPYPMIRYPTWQFSFA